MVRPARQAGEGYREGRRTTWRTGGGGGRSEARRKRAHANTSRTGITTIGPTPQGGTRPTRPHRWTAAPGWRRCGSDSETLKRRNDKTRHHGEDLTRKTFMRRNNRPHVPTYSTRAGGVNINVNTRETHAYAQVHAVHDCGFQMEAGERGWRHLTEGLGHGDALQQAHQRHHGQPGPHVLRGGGG